MVATLLISTFLAHSRLDLWELKPNFETDKKQTWKVSVAANVGGTDIDAKFDHTVSPAAADADGTRKLTITWDNVEVNGAANSSPDPFEVKVGPDGTVLKSLSPDEDDYRRCLSVFAFIYPSKPVTVGDKWNTQLIPTISGAKNMKFEYEAVEATKVGDIDVLRFTGKQSEVGDDGLVSDGVWWVAKDGSVVKYKLTIKNWVVPFTGGGPMDATITGEKK